jgi:translation initiation factor eIF-2B subunit delta
MFTECSLNVHKMFAECSLDVHCMFPSLAGRALLQQLLEAGLTCSYIHISALSYIMPQVTKVFLGAEAVTANGSVKSRVGTAAVAMVAHEWNIPVRRVWLARVA